VGGANGAGTESGVRLVSGLRTGNSYVNRIKETARLNVEIRNRNIEIQVETRGRIHVNIQHGFRKGTDFDFNFNVLRISYIQ